MPTIPSGLQAHSVSLAYPLSVQAKETRHGTRYGVYHATQGRFLCVPLQPTAARADVCLTLLLTHPATRAELEALP